MIYYTADLHFGSRTILHDAARPFASVEEMNRVLTENWNSTVTDTDEVYIVGDFAGDSASAYAGYLQKLRGCKHLLRGNHETMLPDAARLPELFASVSDFLEIQDDGVHIMLCHYPILFEKRGYMIHGHTHNQRNHAYEILKTLPKVLNAGVDINGFRPVTLQELRENNRSFAADDDCRLFPAPPLSYRQARHEQTDADVCGGKKEEEGI